MGGAGAQIIYGIRRDSFVDDAVLIQKCIHNFISISTSTLNFQAFQYSGPNSFRINNSANLPTPIPITTKN